MAKKMAVTTRPDKGRGLFYTRDSAGRSEMTPSQYVKWAAAKARELGVTFSGTGDQIDAMIKGSRPTEGDIFQDYGVKGNLLSRPGLDALLKEITADPTVTHVFIPNSERLVRPEEIIEGIELERRFIQELGVDVVFQDRILKRMPPGTTQSIEQFVVSALRHHTAGRFRYDLAVKALYAQLSLAKQGFSTGGRAKYGLLRYLVRDSGELVRPLDDGEQVKGKGQHVVWVPDEGPRWQTRLRIIQMLAKYPAGKIARMLMKEGVPSPNAGRTRTDGGVEHTVSGIWYPSTITAIGRDPINISLREYGRRSMGDCNRFSKEGPRPLDERDYDQFDRKRRVVRNPESERVRTSAPMVKPATSEAEYRKLLQVLDDRAGSQRGKPRSRNPEHNPLGCRIFDLDCSHPMYHSTKHGKLRYTCSLYIQSNAARCHSNHIAKDVAVRFMLSCIRQRVLWPNLLPRLEERLRELANAELESPGPDQEVQNRQREIQTVDADLKKVSRNMALADSEIQRNAMAEVFEELNLRREQLKAQLTKAETTQSAKVDAEKEVATAMATARRLIDLAGEQDNMAAAGELFQALNAKLFLRFKDKAHGKRTYRVSNGGLVTFGNAPPPVPLYDGPTDRKSVIAGVSTQSGDRNDSMTGSEGLSVGNEGRGTPRPVRQAGRGTELFLSQNN